MDKFLERIKLSKLIQEVENQNKPTTTIEIEFVIQKASYKKKYTFRFTDKFYQTFKWLIRINNNSFQTVTDNRKREIFPKFYKANIFLLTKADKGMARKENYRFLHKNPQKIYTTTKPNLSAYIRDHIMTN